ncbi:LysR family transcriptional regulator [Candidimonas nitroreducens]|uniref:LysR family transcriptional regulator n=1 Tax=Candidimonas nitroreducens TaxID=683354 RepID=A0A225MHB0_9BURK|nr:LysR family transcriptional regulator [Candidimonas nitroreducens]OWT60282.1 LysR family transcriptional regulator [Candidimonas nitroreducens]
MENVRGITTFIRIVRSGNFSTAARGLGITPQAASMHVKQLEDWVGVRLFNRSTRQVSLTEEGTRFYQTCVAAVDAIDDEVERMRDSSKEVFGTVRVAAPVGIGIHFVAPAIGQLLEMHPRISIDLLIQNRIPDVVAEGIDVGVLPHPLPETTLIARRVATSPFVLCASPAYLQRNGTPQTVEELARHRRIALRSWITKTVRPWRFRCAGTIVTSPAEASLITNEADSLIEAMLAGAGIGLITKYRVVPYLRSGRLKTVLDGLVDGELSHSIYMQQRRKLPRKTRVVADFLYDVLSTHPDLRER